jgi:hypothetical protein
LADLTDDQRDAIIASLYAGRRIDAIKQYRVATGHGLKEAKDFIDALEVRLREESPELFQTAAPAGCSGGVVVVILLSAILAALVGLALLIR